ncbi:cytochrome c oxidase assembly protein [Shewanella sp. NIFS-20-20]|uniref:cytochrome c oxidase assembly protein n=1 Tax=Shewanella sp. NIFS-20-20 TaxID=2853806 RepID=UPI001C475673|nr:cytochrome c oxidase assembly protein [Shewanella sp. NIFS-20-20]MBV7316931.1 cytochrome c oxidase assembly protein [Shewanella sp. NIFS-20-20]
MGNANNTRLTIGLIFGAIAMFGFGFALVPLYDVLCEQLGINGKTRSTAQVFNDDTSAPGRLVNVEFIAQVPGSLPWEFAPAVKRMQVRTGELVRTHFNAKNLADHRIVGQAIPSVSPGQGAAYFNKTECFCFNQQPLEGHDSAELGLIFFVDKDLPDSINTLTLAYTLFDITDSVSGGTKGVSK